MICRLAKWLAVSLVVAALVAFGPVDDSERES